MTRPRLLDLFCGAGGAAMGYHRAGFDVTGVDIRPQPRYPFPFVQADALDFLSWARLDSFAGVHASPPCQDHMRTPLAGQSAHGTGWMLPATREALIATGKLWVIENVPGAPLRVDLKLCGCMFGLPKLKRERWFETSWHAFELRTPCYHPERAVTVIAGGPNNNPYGHLSNREWEQLKQQAMGIDWMDRDSLGLAVPPAYTEYIGRQLLDHLEAAA